MLAEYREQRCVSRFIAQPIANLAGKIVEPFPTRPDGDGMRMLHLLHRDALGEITRLIDIAAQANRDVIRQQLQRDDFQDGQQ